MLVHFLDPLLRAACKVIREPDGSDLHQPALPLGQQLGLAQHVVARHGLDGHVEEKENHGDDEPRSVFALGAVHQDSEVGREAEGSEGLDDGKNTC